MSAQAGNEKREKLGSGHDGVVPHGAFPASDGYVFLSAGNQRLWTRCCRATGAEDLMSREGFATNPERAADRAVVEWAVGDVTKLFGSTALLTLLAEAGGPASPVNKVEDTVHDEQVLAIGMLEQVEHPLVDGSEVVDLPMTFEGRYPAHQSAPALRGADTVGVLASLGYDDAGIDALRHDTLVATTYSDSTAQEGTSR